MKIDPVFLSQISSSIDLMRRTGMNDMLIALVVQEIRSRAVSEEFRRIQNLITQNPPHHYHLTEMRDEILDYYPRGEE